jgi:hypothetical protein
MLSFLATLFSLPLPGMFSKQRLHTQCASGSVSSFDIWGCNSMTPTIHTQTHQEPKRMILIVMSLHNAPRISKKMFVPSFKKPHARLKMQQKF